ncbi:P-selectin-like [Haliotis rufescens]|uniref:P-selectin-like n=1 Tax=Haliotis rufescens TaxID=6454 RepID=UPI00201F52E6|nr:P-selectin-like [Haliotis rufescens]
MESLTRAVVFLWRVVPLVGMLGHPVIGSMEFAKMKVSNYLQCYRLCVVTGGCHSPEYDAKSRGCSLYVAPGNNSTKIPDNLPQGYTAEKMFPSPCEARPCTEGHVCVHLESGNNFMCVSGPDCGRPPPRRTLTVSDTSVASLGAASVYTCMTGYNTAGGSGVVVCQNTGQWSSPTLKCAAVDCGMPPALHNQSVGQVTSTDFNSNVMYSCNVGYTSTTGTGDSVCQDTAIWSTPTQVCQLVDCKTPVDRSNADPSVVVATTFNTSVTFTCDAGFRNHGGNDTIICLENGQWSSTSLDCQVIPNWIATKTLSAGPATLTCTDRVSSAGSEVSVSCEDDEMLTGCSAKTASTSGKNNGVKVVLIDKKLFCQIDSTQTTKASPLHASARCCKKDGLQCEYLKDGPSGNKDGDSVSTTCFQSFQVLGCSSYQVNGRLDGTNMDNSFCRATTGSFSVTGVYSYATCCQAPGLSCSVHTLSPRPVGNLMKTTCPSGSTLTGCAGYNAWNKQRGSYIEDDSGTPTCHVDTSDDRTRVMYVCCR